MTHSVDIAVPPDVVFAYVTQPDRWHEWHPASTSAELDRKPLQVGDKFREIITVRYPFISIRRFTEYVVKISERVSTWEVTGKSSLFDLTIHYDFKKIPLGTRFERTLSYDVKGILGWFEPILVRPKIKRQSTRALENLRAKLSSG